MARRLLEAMQAELVDVGLVRRPSVDGPEPPLWLHPRNGTPAPGDGDAPYAHPRLVLGAMLTGGRPTVPLLGFFDQGRTVEIRLRAVSVAEAEDLAQGIAGVLDDRRGWLMGGLRVEQSLVWRPFGVIYSGDRGYDCVMALAFDVTRPAYAA